MVAIGRSDAPLDEEAEREEQEHQKLADSVSQILEEARMLLPGVQALFGFQLIVVFNSGFQEHLSAAAQHLHLAAMAAVVLAAGLLMAPAAYHRRAEPESVSRRFVRIATRLLAWSTYPLLIGICLDFYLVASVITSRDALSLLVTAALFVVLATLWFVLPRSRRLSNLLAE